MATSWAELSVTVAGVGLNVRRAGKGEPLLVLHHDIGVPARLEVLDKLAQSYDVIVPEQAGWGTSQRAEWMRSVRDLAVTMQGLLQDLSIERPSLLGLGFGGWIAAEMATMAPRALHKLALVGPFGIKPNEGFILDQAIISYIDYPTAFFHDPKALEANFGDVSTDQLEAWDIAREMCFRLAWKPYMYSQTLPHLLASVKVPALIVWGEHDKVIAPATASQWKTALPNARVEIVKGAGHAVEMEKPEAMAKLLAGFLK